MNKLKIALCQMQIEKEKKKNIEKAIKMLTKAKEKNCNIAVLPEMFNCPYKNQYFKSYSEIINEVNGGETVKTIKQIAKDLNLYIIAGSIPEIEEGKIYNTSMIINNEGILIAKHRKIHLFDINVKDGITFKESDTLTPGNKITLFDTPWGKLGVMICYDIRFPELSRIMAIKGAKIIFTPAAFNMTTGPAHWDTLFKSRALDNQVFMVGVAPARNENSNYVSYGNSLITSPWGDIIAKLGAQEDILFSEIDLDYENKIREELPLLKHIRKDIYNLTEI
ncbi:carbon-nitrogen hydrolase family protein [Clostridium tepidum]|jgi:predicted amidohydrolase|uniref:Carbon-nitrogen hydrolase n=1 Tax=Clostridium tepidum TaxID=1962263 RepID=A0A1S9I2G8_9CLOT|nr:carbon-nitrogen hydrolase family protein [Clostridium tepidum]MCR1933089.1 carbon-nitrogen hydrolase family protein [Clostridium tepidum]MDU6877259.1 carbon-nitrogen hydrolase family protein [Clostridium botulinum]OOO62844.1 carbon-nitrogen hydrolase [Clostridium tepidum]OOO64445.1 carbon-nitrogen hydrolase [Clostridium tepidum]